MRGLEGEMSTSQVPGYVAANRDVLAPGCWAEDGNGYRMLALAVEAAEVAFKDVRPGLGATVLRAPLLEFQQNFSDIGLVWHDKTPAPRELVVA